MVIDFDEIFRKKKKKNTCLLVIYLFHTELYKYENVFTRYSVVVVAVVVCLFRSRRCVRSNQVDQMKTNVFRMVELSTRKSINQSESESVG